MLLQIDNKFKNCLLINGIKPYEIAVLLGSQ